MLKGIKKLKYWFKRIWHRYVTKKAFYARVGNSVEVGDILCVDMSGECMLYLGKNYYIFYNE